MSTRITVEQLERMKVHELADLLANVVLLLKRMPNVECRELLQSVPDDVHFSQAENASQPSSEKTWDEKELRKMKKDDLTKVAKELHISFSSKATKNDLIEKILARPAGGRSEQYAIQEML
jgi:hypothetical protein